MMRTVLFCCLFVLPVLAAAQKQEARPVVGKGVVFFGPSVTESDTIDANNSEALGDFSTYTGKVVSFLQKQNLIFKYLSDRTIEIQLRHRKTFNGLPRYADVRYDFDGWKAHARTSAVCSHGRRIDTGNKSVL